MCTGINRNITATWIRKSEKEKKEGKREDW